MSRAKLNEFYSTLYEWRKPILAFIGVGAGVGIITISFALWRRRRLNRAEVVYGQQVAKKPHYNRVLILGMESDHKALLLARLTRIAYVTNPAGQSSNGFQSVSTVPSYSKKTVEFVSVSGRDEHRQYWTKFTSTARVILVFIDLRNIDILSDLILSLQSCIDEAKQDGVEVLYVFDRQDNTDPNAELEAEKCLCLEGLVKNPRTEIININLSMQSPDGITLVENALAKIFGN